MAVSLVFFKNCIKSAIEYRTDFFFRNVSMLLTNGIFLGSIVYLAYQIGAVGVLSFEEIFVGLTIGNIAFVFAVNFFSGIANFGDKVISGDLDQFLIRPYPAYLQTLFSNASPYVIAEVITAMIFLAFNDIAYWPFILFYSICSGIILHFTFFIFQLIPLYFEFNEVHGLPDIIITAMFYPIGIFNPFVKFVLLFIIPGGLVSFGPVLALHYPWFYAIYFGYVIGIVLLFWLLYSQGLKKYRSAGY